jgi:hypothetical protein
MFYGSSNRLKIDSTPTAKLVWLFFVDTATWTKHDGILTGFPDVMVYLLFEHYADLTVNVPA